MADKRLDQENVLTDFDYALIVKGTDVAKISKADLAKVVGGLMSSLQLFPFEPKGTNPSMDFQKTSLKSGIYYINESSGKPSHVPFGYGIIVRFMSSVYGFMLGADVVGKKLYVSYGTEAGFGSWTLIK